MEMTIEYQDESNNEHDASNAHCVLCGWSRAYKSASSAKRGLAAHLPLCPKKADAIMKSNEIIAQWFDQMTGGNSVK